MRNSNMLQVSPSLKCYHIVCLLLSLFVLITGAQRPRGTTGRERRCGKYVCTSIIDIYVTKKIQLYTTCMLPCKVMSTTIKAYCFNLIK